jgi:hypothetical protein
MLTSMIEYTIYYDKLKYIKYFLDNLIKVFMLLCKIIFQLNI